MTITGGQNVYAVEVEDVPVFALVLAVLWHETHMTMPNNGRLT